MRNVVCDYEKDPKEINNQYINSLLTRYTKLTEYLGYEIHQIIYYFKSFDATVDEIQELKEGLHEAERKLEDIHEKMLKICEKNVEA